MALQSFASDVVAAEGGLRAGVAEQSLHVAQRDALIEPYGADSATQRVWADGSGDASRPRGRRDVAVHGSAVHAGTAAYDSEQYFFEALKAGASGYVLKSVADRDLVEACRAAMRGEPFLYPEAMTALMREYLQRGARGERLPGSVLTTREAEVVKLIAEGRSSKDIAVLLFISTKTVERHRANILQKLELRDRTQLTRYAIRTGLVEP